MQKQTIKLKPIKYTEEERKEMDEMAQEFVAGLNKASIKSEARHERWEKIFAIEKSKWPQNMGSKLRTDIPKNLHSLLDKCITKSQDIARGACQTEELTEKYLKENHLK